MLREVSGGGGHCLFCLRIRWVKILWWGNVWAQTWRKWSRRPWRRAALAEEREGAVSDQRACLTFMCRLSRNSSSTVVKTHSLVIHLELYFTCCHDSGVFLLLIYFFFKESVKISSMSPPVTGSSYAKIFTCLKHPCLISSCLLYTG